MILAWVTDPHLEWLSESELSAFLDTLAKSETDVVVISGDISSAAQIKYHLKRLAQLPMPVDFVLGNHDIYESSFNYVHKMVRASVKQHENLMWLSEDLPVRLTNNTYLIGHDGWADGRAGTGQKSGLLINDYRSISDFRGLSVGSVFSQMQTLADIATRRLVSQIRDIGAKHIIVITHAPPFLEACLYMGKPTEVNFAPHFSNISMGEALKQVVAETGARLSILCGHTHDEARVNINPQIAVHAGWASYGSPTYIQIEVDVGC